MSRHTTAARRQLYARMIERVLQGPCATSAIAEDVGMDVQSIRWHMRRLLDEHVIRPAGRIKVDKVHAENTWEIDPRAPLDIDVAVRQIVPDRAKKTPRGSGKGASSGVTAGRCISRSYVW